MDFVRYIAPVEFQSTLPVQTFGLCKPFSQRFSDHGCKGYEAYTHIYAQRTEFIIEQTTSFVVSLRNQRRKVANVILEVLHIRSRNE